MSYACLYTCVPVLFLCIYMCTKMVNILVLCNVMFIDFIISAVATDTLMAVVQSTKKHLVCFILIIK